MAYLLNEERKMIKDLVQKIAQEKMSLELIQELDEKGIFPWEILKVLASSDLFGVYIEEKYGGFGKGCFELCLVVEELSKVCGGIAVSYAASGLGTFPIILFGNEEQKQKYLPQIASGKKLAAFGLTESEAGSDAGAIQTTAVLEGDHYVLNGTKQWITNGGEAEIYTIIAMTNKSKGSRGASAFIVEKDTPGFTFGKKENKMGIRCSATSELVFNNCKIPKENLIAKEGMGFIVAMKTLDYSRPGVAVQAVGMAQGALDHAIKYSRERKQFGYSISTFQGIQFMLADMATSVEAARALVYQTAEMVDNKDKNVSKFSAMCKLFASDVCMKVTTDAVQIFGGYGYMKEYPVEKMMRDAKITQIYEGTNQIQRGVIALELIRESAAKK